MVWSVNQYKIQSHIFTVIWRTWCGQLVITKFRATYSVFTVVWRMCYDQLVRTIFSTYSLWFGEHGYVSKKVRITYSPMWLRNLGIESKIQSHIHCALEKIVWFQSVQNSEPLLHHCGGVNMVYLVSQHKIHSCGLRTWCGQSFSTSKVFATRHFHAVHIMPFAMCTPGQTPMCPCTLRLFQGVQRAETIDARAAAREPGVAATSHHQFTKS